MGWIGSSFLALFFWGMLYVFSEKAAPNGGEINLLLETASVLVVIAFLSRNITRESLSQVTFETCVAGLLAGLMYGIGTYFFFTALNEGAGHVKEIAMITGMNPVLGLLIIVIVGNLFPRFLTEMEKMRPVQWAGVVVGGFALVLINWSPKWTSTLLRALGK